ncbi:MAG: thermonuclease family protein [Patescibacteria group bacterium]
MEQLLSFLIILMEWWLPSPSPEPTMAPVESGALIGTTTAAVLRVIDGDTIVVASGTTERTVRYIGIDAPEHYTNRPPECYAAAATRANQELVAGQTVQLVPDVELTDKYGRDLRYVYVGDTFVNEALVAWGYARSLPIPPNRTYASKFYAAEQAAVSANNGLWEACE